MVGNPISPDFNEREGQNVASVHDRLRDEILRGSIPAGSPTSQVLLAKQLGVSRTPLREALRLLEREGLVISSPNRRVRIAELSAADAEALYATRISLEAPALRVTIPTLDTEDFAELEGFIAQMEHHWRAGDAQRYAKPHGLFHARLVSAAPPRMTQMIEQLFDHAGRYRAACAIDMSAHGNEFQIEHRAILHAAMTGDVDGALERLLVHYATGSMLVVSHFDPNHEPVLLNATIAGLSPAAALKLTARSPALSAP